MSIRNKGKEPEMTETISGLHVLHYNVGDLEGEVSGDATTRAHHAITGWAVAQAERSIWERVAG